MPVYWAQTMYIILMISNLQIKTMDMTLKNLAKFVLLLVLVTGCQDDDKSFGTLDAPTNLEIGYTIVGQDTENPNGDGSGQTTITAHADGAMTYKFVYPDGTSDYNDEGFIAKRFSTNGVNSYIVTVIATGKGGVSTTGSIEIKDLLSVFNDPITTQLLTNNSTKTWYFAKMEQGHLGVGPNTPTGNNYWPEYYGAAPNEKAGSETSSCLYSNKLKFTSDNGLIKYELDNGGNTFFNKDFTYLVETKNEDFCLPYNTTGQKTVLLEPSNSFVPEEFTTGTQMTFTNNGFMGYYIGTSTYEILELTSTRMVVRAVMGGNPALAWYHTFTSIDPDGVPAADYTNLVWADEFDVDGAPNPANWNMEIGNGQNGWGNQEKQYYRAENAVVSNGSLKITAKKESFGGFQYTSARMNTHNHKDFTYGKVEIKAKLPGGDGCWSALWMLGSNYASMPWPACGEIDIMEHVAGDTENHILGTLHYPGNSGGNSSSGFTEAYTDVTSAFHIYTLIWSPETITWLIDGTPYRTAANPGQPFKWDYFLIFNVAMGGTLGGGIDPNFTQSTMEVEYVRLYQ